ncbi:MAG: phosphomannomutase/phosphoglucomutase, partial [Pseudomonadota bacterium]
NQDLNEEVMYWIGRAIGSEAIELNQTSICVARDGRISGPILIAALKSGLQDSGLAVIDIGMVPTPVLYFATYHLKTQSGVMLTGSHNPPNYNGLKIVLGGNTLSGDSIQSLYQRIKQKNFVSGEGSEDIQDVSSAYTDRIASDVILSRPLHVVIDCGNGVTGCMVPHLFQQLGARVDSLFNEVDGMFPNHHPDPSKPENLKDLIQKVTEVGADFGIAFDGDGDRIGIVTNTGEIIYPDRLMMLISQDVLKKNPGASIIFDVKCTSDLANLISSWGGKPIMSRTGHSLIKAKLKETKAALAGEMSGHIFFNDRWYGFDDALYTAARVLEILSEINKTSGEVFESYPKKMTTPEINIAVTEASKFLIVDAMIEKAADFGGKKTTIDGLRIDYENGWGLLRASNTTPMLVARFEADDENTLEEIKDKFRTILLEIDSDLDLPF